MVKPSSVRLLKVRQLDRLLGATGRPFFGGSAPVVADYFVFESLSRARDVFGMAFTSRFGAAPSMQRLDAAMQARPALAAYVASGGVPSQVTASPNEPLHRAVVADALA